MIAHVQRAGAQPGMLVGYYDEPEDDGSVGTHVAYESEPDGNESAGRWALARDRAVGAGDHHGAAVQRHLSLQSKTVPHYGAPHRVTVADLQNKRRSLTPACSLSSRCGLLATLRGDSILAAGPLRTASAKAGSASCR